jgi:DNA-directed RNA polymerase specialized sigma24 family protein
MGGGVQQNAMNYEEITKSAFQIASFYLADEDSAKEIAQLTAIECFVNKENLKQETLTNWVFTVAKNKSLNLIKSQNRKLDYDPLILAKTTLDENLFEQKMDLITLLTQIPMNVINQKDRKLLLHAFQRGVKNAARDLNRNEQSFRLKIYRLKQELILYHRLESGFKRLNPIPGTRLHHNLMNFIKRIGVCLNNNDFCFLDEFELDEKSRYRLEQTSIRRVVKYQIDILKKNLYLFFVAFFDTNGNMKSLRFQIIANSGNRLQISTLPELPQKIIKINNRDIPTELKEKLKPDKNGLIPLFREELDKELNSKVKKIEVVFDIKEYKIY